MTEPTPEKKSDKKLILIILALFVVIAGAYAISLGPIENKNSQDYTLDQQAGMDGTNLNEDLNNNVETTPFNIESAMKERILGDTTAPIKISEYSSFSCTHCGDFHRNTFDQFKANYIDTGKAYMVFSDFPLNAPALHASMAARCVNEDSYFEFVQSLFTQQDEWAFNNPKYLDYLKDSASKYGLSGEDFKTCIASQELQNAITQRMQAAQTQFKVSSTPTFVVNNREVISGALPYNNFVEAIEAAVVKMNTQQNPTIEDNINNDIESELNVEPELTTPNPDATPMPEMQDETQDDMDTDTDIQSEPIAPEPEEDASSPIE